MKPDWLKIRPPDPAPYSELKGLVGCSGVATVCQESKCPNLSECWSKKTLTFMVMGDVCTRSCRFCNVKSGKEGVPLNRDEPRLLAESLRKLGLKHAVLTTVTRDDLPDQGAGHLASCIHAVKALNPGLVVEVLTQDFQGDVMLVKVVAESGPDVFAHNVECVQRLQKSVRDRRAGYEQSLSVLRCVKRLYPSIVTKSSLMVGLGESEDEVVGCLKDLAGVGVEIVTIGQYLQPNSGLLPVKEYVSPEQFKKYECLGVDAGLKVVRSGPFVRSSYKAHESYLQLRGGKG